MNATMPTISPSIEEDDAVVQPPLEVESMSSLFKVAAAGGRSMSTYNSERGNLLGCGSFVPGENPDAASSRSLSLCQHQRKEEEKDSNSFDQFEDAEEDTEEALPHRQPQLSCLSSINDQSKSVAPFSRFDQFADADEGHEDEENMMIHHQQHREDKGESACTAAVVEAAESLALLSKPQHRHEDKEHDVVVATKSSAPSERICSYAFGGSSVTFGSPAISHEAVSSETNYSIRRILDREMNGTKNNNRKLSSSAQILKEREKKKFYLKHGKSKDGPKRPSSAYNYFVRSQSALYKVDKGGDGNKEAEDGIQKVDSQQELVRLIAIKWKSSTTEDKVPYVKLAEEDKLRYRKERMEHEGKMKESPKQVASIAGDGDENHGDDEAPSEDSEDCADIEPTFDEEEDEEDVDVMDAFTGLAQCIQQEEKATATSIEDLAQWKNQREEEKIPAPSTATEEHIHVKDGRRSSRKKRKRFSIVSDDGDIAFHDDDDDDVLYTDSSTGQVSSHSPRRKSPSSSSNATAKSARASKKKKKKKQASYDIEEGPLPRNFTPLPYSVILGKSQKAKECIGNLRLRVLANYLLPKYAAASSNKSQKSKIVSLLLSMIHEACPVGAFIRRGDGGRWHRVRDSVAREKIGYTFRELLGENYRSSSLSKAAQRSKGLQKETTRSIDYGSLVKVTIPQVHFSQHIHVHPLPPPKSLPSADFVHAATPPCV